MVKEMDIFSVIVGAFLGGLLYFIVEKLIDKIFKDE